MNSTDFSGSVLEDAFLLVGMQYYIAARSAALANLIQVCGNLYHHALEMFLKAVISRKYTIGDLKSIFRHNLPKIWNAFKAEFSSTELIQFDTAIADLHKFENIRYPEGVSERGGLLFLEWDENSSQDTLEPGFPTYKINVIKIDYLVLKIFEVSSSNFSLCMYTLKSNPYVREILTRHNPVGDQILRG
jgi:hypothetical protein